MRCLGPVEEDGRLALARVAYHAIGTGQDQSAKVSAVPDLGAGSDQRRPADASARLDPCAFRDLNVVSDEGTGLHLAADARPQHRAEILRQPRQRVPGIGAAGEQFAVLPSGQVE
jgi:hypothetical protein